MVRRTLIVAGGLLALVLGAASGGFLVVDEPRKSDVIMVLAGETDRRPARALELFDQGYASKIVLDVPAPTKIYRWTQPELAQKYVIVSPRRRQSQFVKSPVFQPKLRLKKPRD